ncbi:hypothetical protein COCVIDRAFT_96446, partial [Bipolaris victoriae FI3]
EEGRIKMSRPEKDEASKADFPTLPRFPPKSSTPYRVITCIILAPVYTTHVSKFGKVDLITDQYRSLFPDRRK